MIYAACLIPTLMFWFFAGNHQSLKEKIKDTFLNCMTLFLYFVLLMAMWSLEVVSDEMSHKTHVCEESGGSIYNARCYERDAVETLLNSEIKLEKIENEK